MWPTVTDVAWSVSLSVCLYSVIHNGELCCKSDEPIEMSFEVFIQAGPVSYVGTHTAVTTDSCITAHRLYFTVMD